jgi:AraC family transcriptional regulator of adaptative response/methylated-DNA-[protein]-cysteine methyltransferase
MTGAPGEISNVDWHAVVKKDRHYDGKFVYAAVTTGIYCRPSCPARNPQRRNTLIFLTEKSIKAALDYIETHLDQAITLNTLSQVSGLSPHHLQETFKRIVGLSPKAFCDARRIARFKQYLRAGQSISSACYEVGYGSSRALYEKTTRFSLGRTCPRSGPTSLQRTQPITKRSSPQITIRSGFKRHL